MVLPEFKLRALYMPVKCATTETHQTCNERLTPPSTRTRRDKTSVSKDRNGQLKGGISDPSKFKVKQVERVKL